MLSRVGQRRPQPRARALLAVVVGVVLGGVASGQDYEVPEPVIEAFHPKGLKVSIPDSDGVQLFAFHGNVNRALAGVEAGELSADVTRRAAGRWTYSNASKRLKVGDVLSYWLYVQRDGRGYQRLGQTHQITELIPTSTQVQSPEEQTALGGLASGDYEYRPSPPTYESRPPPRDSYRPPPYESRPPPDRPPPYDSRPPPDRPPPYDSRPPPDRPPPYDSRPPPDRPPPYDSQPPPQGSRPHPYESRPPHYGSRPPPPPGQNFEYPPPPPVNQPTGSIIHNHKVGYANTSSEDLYPAGNFNAGDRYPSTVTQQQPYNPVGQTQPQNPVYQPNSNNFNTGDRYPTGNGDYQTTGIQQQPYSPVSQSPNPVFQPNANNVNSGDRYPTGNGNYETGTQQPYNPVGQSPNPVYQPNANNRPIRPTVSVGTSTDQDLTPTLGAFGPTESTWGQQSQQGQGAAGAGLPLTGNGFAAPASVPAVGGGCELSATYVNGRPACKGQVVFEEDWKTLNTQRWSHEVKISGSPDFEFCIYTQHPENTFTKNGLLHLKPTLTNDKYGQDFVRRGKLQLDDCTAGPVNSDSCAREAMFSYILPPVVASRINTRNSFSFKYGKIEVRTRLPRGDWIYPELWLQPLREEYGPGLASGRVHLAMARGNRRLTGPAPEYDDLSGKTLVAGALAGGASSASANARRKFFTKSRDTGLWTDQFHNYTLLWTPETLAFSVDGVEFGVARPEAFGGLLHGRVGEQDDPWTQGSRIAPFDKEFYISIGIAVGGVHAFPDGSKSGNHDKPWKNTGAKAMLSFWNARDVWYSTWNGQSDLLVESVRVTALNN